jgi:ComF family protein
MPIFEILFQSLFPDRCVGCRAKGALLCETCLSTLPPAPAPHEAFISSVFAYADPRVRRLVKLLKYKNTRHAACLFGAPLAGALAEFLGEEALFISSRKILLVPVPLAKARRKSRGYNQAELLARAMLEHLDAPNARIEVDTNLLEKNKDTKAQADIPKKSERLKNLGDCFRVREGRSPEGETVILVDDVTTTGATLVAARAALLRAGFRSVYALTVAH